MSQQDIEAMLAESEKRSLLRISTAGSVDDGKSTFIGRLLYDCKGLYEDTIESLKGSLRSHQRFEDIDLAGVTDGLRAEREQGITIDVAYRYFSTPKRQFILADTPGHEMYTRNMATGASTANVAILLIDARYGVTTQTKRHAFISSILGIPRLMVAVNKMDLVDWAEDKFTAICADFSNFAAKLTIQELKFVPISALLGDNVVNPSSNMPWYAGTPVIRYLEDLYIDSDRNLVDFRYPVQFVLRPNQDFRGYSGQIVSGAIRTGEEIVVLPSHKTTRITGIHSFEGKLEEAHTPMSVTLTLKDEIDISRGDMIVRAKNRPRVESDFEAMLIWMNDKSARVGQTLRIQHTTQTTKCRLTEIQYKIDVDSLGREETDELALNEIARVSLAATKPLFVDNYSRNRATGCFILIDELTNATLAAGTIIDRLPRSAKKAESIHNRIVSGHITIEKGLLGAQDHVRKQGYKPVTLWLTGLSGSGKSTIAINLEKQLFDRGYQVCRLDGDNVRSGLCRDLGFSDTDRSENIRRVAEVSKLMNNSGSIVICSFISPFANDRALAKEIVGEERFLEVFVDTPLAVCESRDPKGLYRKARAGEIKGFSGLDAPYEAPSQPDLHLLTAEISVEKSLQLLEAFIETKIKLTEEK